VSGCCGVVTGMSGGGQGLVQVVRRLDAHLVSVLLLEKFFELGDRFLKDAKGLSRGCEGVDRGLSGSSQRVVSGCHHGLSGVIMGVLEGGKKLSELSRDYQEIVTRLPRKLSGCPPTSSPSHYYHHSRD